MQPKTLLAMFVLVSALGGFIFFYEQDLPSTDERRALEKKVLGIEKDEVEALTITWDGQKVRLERQEPPLTDEGETATGLESFATQASWRLVEPLLARADGDQVNRLLTSLTDLEHQRVVEEVDREDAGFNSPQVRVTVTTAQGETELLFGAELPASSHRMVAVSGRNGAYVAPSAVLSELQQEPGAWRDKKLFTGTRSDIDRVTLEQADQRLVLARRGDDFWLESPFADPADEERVNNLIAAITGLTVTTFLDRPLLDQPFLDPATMGLDPAEAVLEVVRPGVEEPFRLELGLKTGAGDVRFGRTEDELFELDAGLAEAFAASPGDWRSRAWASLQVFQINSATFTDGTGTTTIRRQDAEWLRGDDKIDYSTASDLLYAVADARAERVLDVQGNLTAPDLTVTLTSEDLEETLHLYNTKAPQADAETSPEPNVGPPATAGALASREGREALLTLSAEAALDIHSKLAKVRTAEVLFEEETDTKTNTDTDTGSES